ncbi:MAG TPA: fibrobacter succinogenes major paralogous domain-containing protein [Panacibacter sp.]|nr:fibrobacter succinogenes major paralogous domain-containing protein [Panacibacter sp.]
MKEIIQSGFTVLILLPAISCKKENSISPSLAVNSKSSTEASVIDIDGVAAIPIKIGTQRWMAKNLNVGRYRNGDKIPQVKDPAAWDTLTTGAWCYYNNDPANGAIYGKLYNWYAVNDPRGLAPVGYHIPSYGEWETLSTFLGGDAVAGAKMKSTGTTEAGTGLWYYPNTDATNSTGFTGLPGGYRNNYAMFYYSGSNGYWWSSAENINNIDAYYRNLSYDNSYLFSTYLNKNYGYSVRCVKD